jgi:protein ImuA
MPHDNKLALEELHPSLWRASQLARSNTRVVRTGHAVLDQQLPGGGWPVGTLVELLVAQHGIGELRFLKTVLAAAGKRRVMLVQPPYLPNALALASLGLDPSKIVWVQTAKSADALWAAEQTLRAGGFHSVLLWVQHAKAESMRRLNLAAQQGEALFVAFRPLSAAQDPSPASLRLALRPALHGLDVEFVKRRGPNKEAALFIPLSPSFTPRHAPVDRSAPVKVAAGSLRADLVE